MGLTPEAQEPPGRHDTHGHFDRTAATVVALYDAFERACAGKKLPPSQKHAVYMICVKLARIASGDNYEPDHWRDLVGYPSLVLNSLQHIPRPVE